MVEATVEVSTPLIWLSEAAALLADRCGSPRIAERLLGKGLSEERVRWMCQLLGGDPEGWNLPILKPAASGKFWQGFPVVDWSGNSARRKEPPRLVGFVGGGLPPTFFPRPPETPEIYMIKVVAEDLRALLPRGEAPTATTAPTEIKPLRGPQADRILRVLRDLHPPHGVVPPSTTIETVRGKVAAALAEDSRQRGLADPGWDVVSRCVEYLRALYA
jgi:hypothetical protein